MDAASLIRLGQAQDLDSRWGGNFAIKPVLSEEPI
jgi:hypothetical protein